MLRQIKKVKIQSLQQTDELAVEICKHFKGKLVIGLQGEVGAGKTHFVKALAGAMGFDSSSANSPSFAIIQEYKCPEAVIQHVDLYRLETVDEIESSGFWDLFYEENVIIAVEWIDRIEENQIPETFNYIRLDWRVIGSEREVTIFTRAH